MKMVHLISWKENQDILVKLRQGETVVSIVQINKLAVSSGHESLSGIQIHLLFRS